MRLVRLRRLLRIRDREVDAAQRRRATTLHARNEAAREVERSASALASVRSECQDQARRGATAVHWQTARAGLFVAEGRVRQAELELSRTDAEDAAALGELLEARRRQQGLARIAERAREDERLERERAEEAALDDVGQRARSRAGTLLCLLLLVTSAGSARAEEDPMPESPTPKSVTRLVEELRQREMQLERRERELVDRELHVEDLERKVMSSLGELDQLATSVEKRISDWEQANGDKSIKRLAKIYGTMEPRRAAPLLEELELDLATRIVSKMKHKESAALLPLMSQERALAMSRIVAHPLGGSPANGEQP